MSEEIDLTNEERPEDRQALATLGDLLRRVDAVPDHVVAAAKASYAWRTIDEELAALAHDSLEDPVPVLLRGPGAGPRLLEFEAADLTIEVEVACSGDRCRLVGQLVPPQPGTVEVRHGGGTLAVEADQLGRFAADGVSPGPVSLRCALAAGGPAVVTAWVVA